MKRLIVSLVATGLSLAPVHSSLGALTDLANAPVANVTTAQVKPNIYFILDDSGSMAASYLPDEANGFSGKYGFKSKHCNALAYDPSFTYTPPVDANGNPYPNATYPNAKLDGYDASSASSNLANDVYYVYTGSQQDLNFTFKTNGSLDTNSTFYKECVSSIGNNPGQSVFTEVKVNTLTASEQQNYANWFSYYRTRILAMKTAAGKAFKDVTDSYRVGFSTISYAGTDSNDIRFLKIADFTSTHKQSFYNKLYSSSPSGWTPLRGALSKAGRLYAGQLLTGSDDPVQYSCQQNFTILSTDGYWNTNAETSTYGPYQINNSTLVGDQDGVNGTPTPMYDAKKVANTLADVAMYYYVTDLRPTGSIGALGTDVSNNNVPKAGNDDASHQHMTTFTLGLGVSGQIKYQEDYLSCTNCDFEKIKQGTLPWPNPNPTASSPTALDEQARIDDLWHAAVNGRGVYFSATNPASLASGLQKALAGVSAKVGAAAAAATSSLEPVAGDNFAYVASYRTVYWDGDLEAFEIDLATGALGSTPVWQAQGLLNAKVGPTSDSRVIYTFDANAANKLRPFQWSNFTAAEQSAYFSGKISSLSQYASWTAAEQTAATGQTLLSYLRGQDGYEDQAGNTYRLYRDRTHVLGDMVHSQPVYVKAPPFNYNDTGYAAFKAANANRDGTVYVGANDGMLHAFDAVTGQERWAYVPPAVLGDLWRLADKNYSNQHRYYVDGVITVGDVYDGSAWRTILVGGLGKGGRAFYALDVTNPSAPKALWNFDSTKDQDLGYSYGNPVITKRADGTWVVLVTSGYNNVSPGSGEGYLYVLNAMTGAVLDKIGTGKGNSSTPSGLAKIAGWVDNPLYDNTTLRVYGGDLLGNLWRFDINDMIPPSGKEAMLLAELEGGGVGPQPVTTKPELGEINGKSVIYVGTGKLLASSDLTANQQQSIYAIQDDLGTTGLGKVRNGSDLVQQTVTDVTVAGVTYRTASGNPVNWNIKKGWYVDLPDGVGSSTMGSERVDVNPKLQLGTLFVPTNVPTSDACNTGGYSWLYQLDFLTGSFVPSAAYNAVATKIANSLAVGTNVVKLGDKTVVITTTAEKKYPVQPANINSGGLAAKRVSWRELFED